MDNKEDGVVSYPPRLLLGGSDDCYIRDRMGSVQDCVTVDPKFTCPICFDPIIKYHVISCFECSHLHCTSCLRSLLESGEDRFKCSVCRAPVCRWIKRVIDNNNDDDIDYLHNSDAIHWKNFVYDQKRFHNKAIDAVINDLYVCKCKWCDWKGSVVQWRIHVEQCKHIAIACSFCSSRMTLGEFAQHKERCDRIEVVCHFCSTILEKRDLSNHIRSCPDRNIRCPYCATSVAMETAVMHMITCNMTCQYCFDVIDPAHSCSDCDVSPTTCRRCHTTMRLDEYALHKTMFCSMDYVTCILCSSRYINAHGGSNVHRQMCPEVVDKCHFCNVAMTRRALVGHVGTCGAERITPCTTEKK